MKIEKVLTVRTLNHNEFSITHQLQLRPYEVVV